MKKLLLVGICSLAALVSRAHTIWIEPMGDSALVIRFAEPDNKFETSPGYLDSLTAPISFIVSNTTSVAVESPKKSDHFLLVGASKTNVAGVETVFTVRAGRKPYFYARWQPAGLVAGTPLLTLDLVPTGKAGEVKAWFRGKPLPGAKATLRPPDGSEKEIVADDSGLIHFEAKKPGQYLLTIPHYRETLPGFFAGQAYKETSHNTALTWRQE